jgi:hypothetical protein
MLSRPVRAASWLAHVGVSPLNQLNWHIEFLLEQGAQLNGENPIAVVDFQVNTATSVNISVAVTGSTSRV